MRAQGKPISGCAWSATLLTASLAFAPDAGQASSPVFERNGVRIFAAGTTINNSRSVELAGKPVPQWINNLSLRISWHLAEGDTNMVAGVGSITAKDDRGNLLFGPQALERAFGFRSQSANGEMQVQLGAPDPLAKKLLWVEGELFVFQVLKQIRIEIPFVDGKLQPAPEKPGVRVRVVGFSPEDAQSGASIVARILMAAGSDISLPGAAPRFEAIGLSGRNYSPRGSGSSGTQEANGTIFDVHASFPRIAESIKAFILTMSSGQDPHPLVTFRLTDIPLPPDPPFQPRQPNGQYGVPNGTAVPSGHPYFQDRGGMLLSRVSIPGRSTEGGFLSVGLASRIAGEWSTTRWLEVPVGSDGTARLADVKPGHYRVLRSWFPTPGQPALTGGVWKGVEVEVDVPAGKTVRLPPLQWAADGAAAGAARTIK